MNDKVCRSDYGHIERELAEVELRNWLIAAQRSSPL